ncbi:hypothetical protein KFE25_010080 [Diacronema lutheri]|uniref:Uncharacterized protein n=1 Tax=Diacronema lutheri TaxID=2081491 RepID=A0A8J5XID2_DIALT|nr:hypothetical protein KFE25_010080 [Diacronema lutheri]
MPALDVEGVLQEVLQMEARVGHMQTERLELEQRVLVAQQRQAQHIRPQPGDAEELEKAEEARLRRQLDGVRAQVEAKEAELKDLLEHDPRAALVVQIEEGVDKYVGESRRLRRALHEQKELVGTPATRSAAARPNAAELELAGLRAQVARGSKEVGALREQAELLAAETVRWEAQADELRAMVGRGGGNGQSATAPDDDPTGAAQPGESDSLAQLEATEALAEQRQRMQLAELAQERARLEAQLESSTRQIGQLMADMPQYAELDVP